MKSVNIRYLPAIDHLRAVGALGILLYHGLQLYRHYLATGTEGFSWDEWIHTRNPFLAILVEGHMAVTLFMVLSGFIFAFGAIDKVVEYRPFIVNRFWRIAPLAILTAVGAASGQAADLFSTLASIFVAKTDTSAASSAFAGMWWAITIEFQFYFVFPFLMGFYQRYGIRYLLGLLAVFVTFRTLVVLEVGHTREICYGSILGRIDDFLLGMMTAVLYVRRPVLNRKVGLFFPLVLLGVVAWIWLFHRRGGFPEGGGLFTLWPTLEAVVFAVFMFAYLPFAARIPRLLSVPLQRVGTWSFSIYLIHYVVLIVLIRHKWVLRFHGPLAGALLNSFVVLMPTTLILSAATYAFIERPFLERRKSYLAEPGLPGGFRTSP